MKIRNGFVSNSSSSSFVVAFPKEPKYATDIKEMLFPRRTVIVYPYADNLVNKDTDVEFPVDKVAATIFEDMQHQKPNDEQNIIDGFSGWLDGMPQSEEFETGEEKEPFPGAKYKTREIDWNAWEDAVHKHQEKRAREFMEKYKDSFIYTFQYADEDGIFGATLEHGNIFAKVPHERISRH